MASYPRLTGLTKSAEPAGGWDEVAEYLIEVWIDDYLETADRAEIVEMRVSGFSYLFDLSTERLLAAWGVSRGRSEEARDKARMAGHPKAGGDRYHRGHAIPHSLGGPTDVNLVPQLGTINVGPFRQLEREAVASPGAFYFTYWSYRGSPAVNGFPGQVPTQVDQGLLVMGRNPRVDSHRN